MISVSVSFNTHENNAIVVWSGIALTKILDNHHACLKYSSTFAKAEYTARTNIHDDFKGKQPATCPEDI